MGSKYETLGDKDLAKLARKLEVVITPDMDRKAVEEAVELKEMEIEEAKAKATVATVAGNNETKEKAGARSDGMVRIEFLEKGTVQYRGRKWAGRMNGIVTKEEAEDLMSQFPTRFRVLGER